MQISVDLTNRVALVTGGSRGIGKSIALSLAKAGANIAICYLKNKAAAEVVVSQIHDIGQSAIAIQADLRDENQVQYLFSKITEEYHRLDILVNNVGSFLMKPLGETSLDEWHEMMNSNLNATFYCSRLALGIMRSQGKGHIINIAFANASKVQAYKAVAAYAIAKTGVLILAKSMAKEVAHNGIRVNVVSPGIISTGLIPENVRQDMVRRIPFGHTGAVDDISNAVLFLVSDRSDYVTGAEIVVSGGWGI